MSRSSRRSFRWSFGIHKPPAATAGELAVATLLDQFGLKERVAREPALDARKCPQIALLIDAAPTWGEESSSASHVTLNSKEDGTTGWSSDVSTPPVACHPAGAAMASSPGWVIAPSPGI